MISTLITRNESEADKQWSNYAIKNKHNLTIYTYNNLNNHVFMKTFKGGSTGIQVAQQDDYYKNYLMKACNDLNVDYPNDKDCSFKRDYYLIRDAESLYFTGYFTTDVKSRLQIKGREAWLVEMFVNKIQNERNLANQKAKQQKKDPIVFNCLLPIYMFSENLKCWCQLDISNFKWIYIMRAPKPTGKYLAFGTDPMSGTTKIELDLL